MTATHNKQLGQLIIIRMMKIDHQDLLGNLETDHMIIRTLRNHHQILTVAEEVDSEEGVDSEVEEDLEEVGSVIDQEEILTDIVAAIRLELRRLRRGKEADHITGEMRFKLSLTHQQKSRPPLNRRRKTQRMVLLLNLSKKNPRSSHWLSGRLCRVRTALSLRSR